MSTRLAIQYPQRMALGPASSPLLFAVAGRALTWPSEAGRLSGAALVLLQEQECCWLQSAQTEDAACRDDLTSPVHCHFRAELCPTLTPEDARLWPQGPGEDSAVILIGCASGHSLPTYSICSPFHPFMQGNSFWCPLECQFHPSLASWMTLRRP